MHLLDTKKVQIWMTECILNKALSSLSCSTCLSDIGVWSQLLEHITLTAARPEWVTSNEDSCQARVGDIERGQW